MKTTYNKSEIFRNAWTIVKTTGKSLSEALKAAWNMAKSPIMEKAIEIKRSWHKATDSIAATYKQVDYLRSLCTDAKVEFPFGSSTNAQRSLTKWDASEAIDALKNGNTIKFN